LSNSNAQTANASIPERLGRQKAIIVFIEDPELAKVELERLTFVKVAETSEIALGQMKAIKLGKKEVLIANVNGAYYAIGNRCTHRNGELAKGNLEVNTVTCPRHKSKFDVTTGKVISGPKVPLIHPNINDEPVYVVKVEGKDILLESP
jgi:nitrite reductase/ring-hydroxylating ferredoxin subunit